MKKLKVAVAGASGYVGAELLRLLIRHPGTELVAVTSESYDGKPVTAAFPGLSGCVDLCFQPMDPEPLASVAEIIFLALPHTASAAPAAALLRAGCRVIDLSADFRLRDPGLYERWYRSPHPVPHLLQEAVYGLPEVYRDAIRQARLVGVPGCYPTGALLGLHPLIREGCVALDSVVVDAASGTSGAGRKLDLPLHFSEANENFKAYAVTSHRHTPEIEQELSRVAGQQVVISFTPHLAPMTRGILSTIYSRLTSPIEGEALRDLFHQAYKGEPFVRVLPLGSFPETKHVLGSNYCDIGLAVDSRAGRGIVITAIDNLVKGAAGQAIQAMNVMVGLEETLGLTAPPLFP
ncbi:MAG: N-acetyl-gamma-glutamyl-phosphate reductase [Candidatus Methylomirabilales bacterium]